ncbi:hypothetical protein LSCM1_00614 [Leishmania martiniquensis]|uniref:Uncharacterized protein n=1 Tax=Leishmania martiniquensis TaxID=1580590 RepID=A0A836GUM6_9TRYP|nr:hypothetical protein LSCM1_00614 [Leishmania martiniquensis]
MPSNTSTVSSSLHTRAAASEYMRTLAVSVPISGPPVIAVNGKTPAAEAAAPPAPQHDNWKAHLAQLLHSMYLVSLIEKAQLGAIHYRGTGSSYKVAKPLSSAAASSPPASPGFLASHEKPMHSVAIDDRWLDAIMRYCRFTCSVDDVARVAMAFNELVRVRWTLQTSRGCAAPLAHTRGDGLPEVTESLSLSAQDQSLTSVRGKTISSVGELRGRLYLMASHVISVEEAEEHLQKTLQRRGTTAAQHAWRELVNRQTAYAAYAASREGVAIGTHGVEGGGDTARGWRAPDATTGSLEDSSDTGTGEKTAACEWSDDQLLQQLSSELRASLSGPMRRALLSQMRRDAAHTEKHEQHRTAERQLSERVVSAYEQVRALLGGKQASGCSAWSLLVAMRDESRFDDALDAVALLSRLLCIPASGLTATMLREREVRVESQPATRECTAATATGKKVRGKRKRGAEETGTASLLLETETVLESVTDLRSLSEEQLQLVRVQLNRASSSVKGVMVAVAQQRA